MIENLTRSRRPLLLSHRDPDPDSLGSTLGLAFALDGLGIDPIVALFRLEAATVPLIELPGFGRIRPLTDELVPTVSTDRRSYDLIVTVDTADPALLGLESTATQRLLADFPVVNIDHHVSNRLHGTCNYVDASAAATAEIIWDLLVSAGIPITPPIALLLQSGLIGDTLGFQIRSTTARTLRAATHLLQSGGHPDGIPRRALNARTFAAMKLYAHALAAAERSEDGRLLWTSVTRELASAIGATLDDAQGIPNGLQDVIGAEVSVVFYETSPNKTRVSLRSVHQPINGVAQEFGGGGHELAAGCTLMEPLTTARDKVLQRLRELLAD